MTNVDYYEYLHENFNELLYGKIGVNKLEKTDIKTKQNRYVTQTNEIRNYEFCVTIPFAGVPHDYNIIFDPENIADLPDFSFDFYFKSFLDVDIDYITENIPSWDNWDITNSKSLINILNEFHIVYKEYQLKLINQIQYSDIKKEYEELLETLNLSEDQVEVFPHNDNEWCDTMETMPDFKSYIFAHYLICLPTDFSELPEYCQEEFDQVLNPGEDYAKLYIGRKDFNRRRVLLYLSPRVEQFLGTVELPKFSEEITLRKYVLKIKNMLEEKIKMISEQHKAKNLFVSALVETFSNEIVEYDTRKFYEVHFIYENPEDYDCLVTVTLDGKFPQEKPKIQLNSLYCQVGYGCSKSMLFHYQPEVQIEENLSQLKDFLRTETRIFKNHKH